MHLAWRSQTGLSRQAFADRYIPARSLEAREKYFEGRV